MSLFVMVYGTLRIGMSNFAFMRDSEFVDRFWLDGFSMFRNREDYYPYVVEGQGRILVELFRVSPEVLQELDRLEDYPDMYGRRMIRVKGVDAWVYVYNLERKRDTVEIRDGDWVAYYNENLLNIRNN